LTSQQGKEKEKGPLHQGLIRLADKKNPSFPCLFVEVFIEMPIPITFVRPPIERFFPLARRQNGGKALICLY
jgi:hypothetical protein